MIYSVNFCEMTVELNPHAVCKYLDNMGWTQLRINRDDVKVYQFVQGENFSQVRIPLNKELSDYKESMYSAIKTIAQVENKSEEQVMLYLLNPNTDILKIRLDKKEQTPGSISFDDAIRLYDSAKKLIAATTLDVINPKKIHAGRTDEQVQSFMNQCRFGQTEIGSYIVSIVCPFAELSSDDEYKQLSIFSEEEECAQSLTRLMTNKLMDNVGAIKKKIDDGDLSFLASDKCDISVNFFEALRGMSFESKNSNIEFFAEWSPVVKNNRSEISRIKLSNDYYQPIEYVINQIREVVKEQTEVIGKIKQLKATPSVDKRETGTIVVAYVDTDTKAKSVTVNLTKEDYDEAVLAHKAGKTVKIVGDLEKSGRSSFIKNANFSVFD